MCFATNRGLSARDRRTEDKRRPIRRTTQSCSPNAQTTDRRPGGKAGRTGPGAFDPQIATSAHAAHRRGIDSTDAVDANRSLGSCKHERAVTAASMVSTAAVGDGATDPTQTPPLLSGKRRRCGRPRAGPVSASARDRRVSLGARRSLPLPGHCRGLVSICVFRGRSSRSDQSISSCGRG